jgi:hypothetical protein
MRIVQEALVLVVALGASIAAAQMPAPQLETTESTARKAPYASLQEWSSMQRPVPVPILKPLQFRQIPPAASQDSQPRPTQDVPTLQAGAAETSTGEKPAEVPAQGEDH